MRQVPHTQYLVIGNGRTARHMTHYLSLLNQTVTRWHYRTDSPEMLRTLASRSDRILLLIRDSSIEPFLREYSFIRGPQTVHFSGALAIEGIENVHPLISFGTELLEKDFYAQIPFALFDSKTSALEEVLPGLKNPFFHVPRDLKALYHGLCVASGNLTVLLWQMVGAQFESQLGVPHDWLRPYLRSVSTNLENHWTSALTGPVARKDTATLLKNYTALQNTPLREIFEAHIKQAWPQFAEENFKQK